MGICSPRLAPVRLARDSASFSRPPDPVFCLRQALPASKNSRPKLRPSLPSPRICRSRRALSAARRDMRGPRLNPKPLPRIFQRRPRLGPRRGAEKRRQDAPVGSPFAPWGCGSTKPSRGARTRLQTPLRRRASRRRIGTAASAPVLRQYDLTHNTRRLAGVFVARLGPAAR
jgi:hypothetical protein